MRIGSGQTWSVARNSGRSLRYGTAIAALMAASAAAPALAGTGSVTNPGFETGDTSGWTTEGGIWQGAWPVPASDYQGHPATLATIVSAGGFDANTGDPLVFDGNYALKLNDNIGGNDITALSQSVTNYTGTHLYYAFNATLEPSHGPTDSPSFLIKVVDKTTNTVVTNIAYSAYNAVNAPNLFRTVGAFVTTDWKVEDVNTISGHDYDLLFVAVDCSHGGHAGFVYVDGFGNAIPSHNADVVFNPLTDVIQGASILLPIGGTPDIDLAKPFYTTTELGAGSVNPNFVGGTLQVDTAGPISTAFTVQSQGGTIDTNGNDVEFSGTFTGAGILNKAGLGALTLSNLVTVDGGVVVNGGGLNVASTVSTLAVDVNDTGTLLGNGQIVAPVNVNSGGTLAPGAEIGTLVVVGGPVTLNTGSTFAVQIDGRNYTLGGGAGSYDRLELMTGGTFVAGGTIAPTLRGMAEPATNTFNPVLGDRFTVVSGGAVSGAFSSVTQPTAGLGTNQRFDVLYHPQDVQLVITPGSFAALGTAQGWRLNAIAAGTGLDAVRPSAGSRSGALQSLFNGLYGFTADGYYGALQQLSGEIHVHSMEAARSAAQNANSFALDAAGQTIGSNCDDDVVTRADGSKRAATCDGNHPAIWTRLLLQHSRFEDDAVATGFTSNEEGFVAGVHAINTPDTRIGIGGRYTETTIQTGIGSHSKATGYSLFGYASQDVGPLNLSAVVSYASADVNATRTQSLTTGSSVSTASYNINSWGGTLQARYDLAIGSSAVIRPVVGIIYDETKADAVKEINGDPNLALTMPEKTWKTWQSKAGLEGGFAFGGGVSGHIGANWLHTLDGDATASRAVTLGAAHWTVSSVRVKDDVVEVSAGLAAAISSKAKVRVDYTGIRDGSSYKADRVSAGLALAF